jgi:conjugal transfer pilus assembly protein TraW
MFSASMSLALCIAASLTMLVAAPLAARDYGQQGTVFPILEPDILKSIETKLRAAEASGKIAAMNKDLAKRTTALVKRPPPVAGLTKATKIRSWTYDPTITIGEDIRDHKGALIIARGRRINPLDTVGLRQSLVFLDGDNAGQVAWALKSTTQLNAKLILTGGSPFDRMKAAQRRFYFDQGGQLTAKFGIRALPAVVEQQGKVLKITEVALPLSRAKAAAP